LKRELDNLEIAAQGLRVQIAESDLEKSGLTCEKAAVEQKLSEAEDDLNFEIEMAIS
jgi:hypothetical protein